MSTPKTSEPAGVTMLLIDTVDSARRFLFPFTDAISPCPQSPESPEGVSQGCGAYQICTAAISPAALVSLLLKGSSPLDMRVQARLVESMQKRPQRLLQGSSRNGSFLLQSLIGLRAANLFPEIKLFNQALTVVNGPGFSGGVNAIEFFRLLPSPGSLSITIRLSMRMASIYDRLHEDLKVYVLRHLDQRSASLYQQCSRDCLNQVRLVATRRCTPEMMNAASAPFVKSFTHELDVALKVWTLRLRLRATTGNDKRGYRLVVQRSDFVSQPRSRFNKSDAAYATLDIFLPTVVTSI